MQPAPRNSFGGSAPRGFGGGGHNFGGGHGFGGSGGHGGGGGHGHSEFVTFAQTKTGIAYANPSTTPASITVTALSSAGLALGSKVVQLAPNAHGAANLGPLLGLNSFTGSVQITSTVPIVDTQHFNAPNILTIRGKHFESRQSSM